jgi:hypothetical protein
MRIPLTLNAPYDTTSRGQPTETSQELWLSFRYASGMKPCAAAACERGDCGAGH